MKISDLWGISVKKPVLKPLILIHWKRPDAGWVKVNTDAIVQDLLNNFAVGGIIRGQDGRFLGAFRKRVKKMAIFEAELIAIVEGVKYCHMKNHSHIIVESDSLAVITFLKASNDDVNWKWWSHVHALNQLSDLHLKFCHIYREGNYVADLLACEVITLGPSSDLSID